MNALLEGWSRETVNTVTDAVGIIAVLAGLAGLVLLDSRSAAGRRVARTWRAGALVMVGFAVLVIGGRFEVLPNAKPEAAAASAGSTTTATAPVTAPGPGSTAGDDQADVSTTTVVDDADGTSTTTTVVGPPAPEPTPETPPPPADAPDTSAADEPDDAVGDDAAGPRGPPAAAYTVASGDNFWSIAAATIEAETGQVPSDADVLPYWQALIDANTSQLAQPGNPDLLLPGQVLDLPPPPALPTA